MPPQENFTNFDLLRMFLVYSWSDIAKKLDDLAATKPIVVVFGARRIKGVTPLRVAEAA